jgi:endonuclease/exonuclease/phosphatase family metal-dependent hydrolase
MRSPMTTLRIATFNVLCGNLFGPDLWPERLPLLRRAIETSRPDVLGLQEVLSSKLMDTADLVSPLTLVPGPPTGAPRWFWVSAVSERNQAGEHLPIAYRADRFELAGSGGFWISATPDRPGSMLSLAPTPFLVHWVRLTPRDRSGSLLVMNAHFGHAPWRHVPTARIVAAQLGALATANPAPLDANSPAPSVFLLGDFNAVPASALVRSLTSASDAGFVDAARSAAERSGPRVTYHWGRGATRMGLWLDYVLARTSLRPTRAEVVDVHDGHCYPSDHHLLVVAFGPPA